MDVPQEQVIPDEILVAMFSVMDSDELSNMYRKSSRYQKLLQMEFVLETIAQSNGIPYVVEHTSKGQLIIDRRINDFYDLIFAMRFREDPEGNCLGPVKKLEIAIRDRDPKLFSRLLENYDSRKVSKIIRLLGEYGDIRLIDVYIDIYLYHFPYQHTDIYFIDLNDIVYWLALYHHNNLVYKLFKRFEGHIQKIKCL